MAKIIIILRRTNTLRFFCRTLTFDGKLVKRSQREEADKYSRILYENDPYSRLFFWNMSCACHVSDLQDSPHSVLRTEKRIHGVRTITDRPTTENGEIYAFNGARNAFLPWFGRIIVGRSRLKPDVKFYPIMWKRWKGTQIAKYRAILLFVRIIPEKRIYKFMFPIRIRTNLPHAEILYTPISQ